MTYHKSPRDVKSCGEINVNEIQRVKIIPPVVESELYDHFEYPYCFEILLNKSIAYYICAATEKDCRNWKEAIEYSIKLSKNYQNNLCPIASISVRIIETSLIGFNGNLYCLFSLFNQKARSNSVKSKLKNQQQAVIFNEDLTFVIYDHNDDNKLSISLHENDFEVSREYLFGYLELPISLIKDSSPVDDWYLIDNLDLTSLKESDQFNYNYHFPSQSLTKVNSVPIKVHLQISYQSKLESEQLLLAESNLLYVSERRNSSLILDTKKPRKSSFIGSSHDKVQVSRPFSDFTYQPLKKPTSQPSTLHNSTSSTPHHSLQPSWDKSLSTPTIPSSSSFSPSSSISSPKDNLKQFSFGTIRQLNTNNMYLTAIQHIDNCIWTSDIYGAIHIWNKFSGLRIKSLNSHTSIIYDFIYFNNSIWSSSDHFLIIHSLVSFFYFYLFEFFY